MSEFFFCKQDARDLLGDGRAALLQTQGPEILPQRPQDTAAAHRRHTLFKRLVFYQYRQLWKVSHLAQRGDLTAVGTILSQRSEEHTSELQSTTQSRMPSSA